MSVNEIVNYEENPDSIVVLGDGKASQKISFQLAQDFYNEITGKSEKLRESSSEPFVLRITHIEQLYHRLVQSTEQYNICSFNENYSINYVDDSSERFSSLNRLKLHVGARGTAIEEVIISYKFLIILPKTSRPQEYTITIKMASRVAKIEGMRKEFGSMPFGIPLFQFESAKVAVFSIDYVDSTVANALMSVIKGWFGSIEKNYVPKYIKFLRRFSHIIPKVTKYFFLFLVSYYVYDLSYKLLPNEGVGIRDAVQFLLVSFLVTYISVSFGMFIGKRIENNLDNIYEQSYVSFTGADENFVKHSSVNIKRSKVRALINLVLTIIIGVGCSVVANNL
ncbi:hypothetical protein [Aeromonas dhakensis]|uniref:hypothetical protein n=1 Tax=Aeromonas dhakensis TaxID=196024 RepID=UPI00111BA6C9|nr:hypothetical protein [Aeromonas dhakensis]MBL0674843.1 hypothetical protein [Aeromonas dhakensis]